MYCSEECQAQGARQAAQVLFPSPKPCPRCGSPQVLLTTTDLAPATREAQVYRYRCAACGFTPVWSHTTVGAWQRWQRTRTGRTPKARPTHPAQSASMAFARDTPRPFYHVTYAYEAARRDGQGFVTERVSQVMRASDPAHVEVLCRMVVEDLGGRNLEMLHVEEVTAPQGEPR